MVFCHTSTCVGHRYTCVPTILNPLPPPSPPHPSGLSQSTGFGLPASLIELALICFTYGNIENNCNTEITDVKPLGKEYLVDSKGLVLFSSHCHHHHCFLENVDKDVKVMGWFGM